MKRAVDLIDCELKWTQPKALKMHYELHAGEELAARLAFRSSFGSFAMGQSADGSWTFKRTGFFQTRVTIRPCEVETDIAQFRNNTWSGGGTLELPDGRRLLATTNLWQTNLEFKTESGETLLRFKSGGLIHLSARVEIEPQAIELAELPWLTMLGWYLIVMMYMDSAAATGVVAAVS